MGNSLSCFEMEEWRYEDPEGGNTGILRVPYTPTTVVLLLGSQANPPPTSYARFFLEAIN